MGVGLLLRGPRGEGGWVGGREEERASFPCPEATPPLPLASFFLLFLLHISWQSWVCGSLQNTHTHNPRPTRYPHYITQGSLTQAGKHWSYQIHSEMGALRLHLPSPSVMGQGSTCGPSGLEHSLESDCKRRERKGLRASTMTYWSH